jgi:acetyltransferase-like isoleucine patch superfamily enzyme
MGWLVRRARRLKKEKIKALPAFDRGKALFELHYPKYECGVGTYGLPLVRDWGEGSTLKVGAYCSIAEEVKILLGGHHRTDWLTTFPFPAFLPEAKHISDYNGTHGDVVIGSDVWLCSGCTILSGVSIGHGAVIAAGALVTKDVEPYAVVGGNPAKFIRWRFSELDRQFLLGTQWWTWSTSEVFQVSAFLCSSDIDAFREYVRTRQSH